jgi:acetyltransferase-like isoleucine patch superfamily enzyme
MMPELWTIIIILLYILYQVIEYALIIWLARRYKITGVRVLNWVARWIFGQNKAPVPVHWTAQVIAGAKITVQDNDQAVLNSFAWSGNCYYQAKNGIEIGRGVIWGPGVKFISANHDPADMSQFLPDPPIVIGPGVWIGAGAIILPGVEIGQGCIIGAGAVITKSFGPGLIIAGNPGRIIKKNNANFIKHNA